MVFAILGAFSAMIFLYLRIEKIQLAFVDFLKMFGFSIVFGAIGSRVLFFLTRVPWLVTHFSVAHLLSSILGGGFVFYGGLFGVLYGIRRYCRKHGIDQRKIYNLIAPAIPLFHAFGRIGCFLAGCCYGFSLSTPIIIFGGLKIHRFPTQIVEAIFVFLLFVVLYFVQRKERKLNYLRIYLLSYAVFRFLIEFTRGDTVRGVVAGISTSQIISVIVIVVCCIKAKKESAQKRAETSEEVCEAEITNA
jgi:phosphatidylglycerol:prolipoprotein diacylglycerol transferase